VISPLVEQASTDAAAILAARERHEATIAARSRAGALRRRSAGRALAEAERQRHEVENLARQRWGSIPRTPEQVPVWAQAAAEQQAEVDPRSADATRRHAHARQEQRRAVDRQERQRGLLRTRLFGNPYSTGSPRRQAEDAQWQAEALRRQLAELEALPVTEAAAQIEARTEAERVAAEALTRRAEGLHDFTRHPSRQAPGIERDGIGL